MIKVVEEVGEEMVEGVAALAALEGIGAMGLEKG